MTDTMPHPDAPAWQLEEVPCDLCGASQADPIIECPDRLLGQGVTFTVVACRSCGLARLNPRPTAESLDAGYAALFTPPKQLEHGFDPPGGLLRWAP